ncbi:unnamed protein product [Rotaria sp. Silwood1]|nr:unnamed protein product [Rotaria sp. Silwood1]CAF1647213.1 unnamed protein product [Rotaria sp. Silwood1]
MLVDLSNSYPIFNNELVFIKQYVEKLYLNNRNSSIEKKRKDYELILSFLYQELNKKSKFVQETYEMFYDYCKTTELSPSSNRNIINLMKLITIVHRDSVNTSEANIDHAQFQVILFHTLFQKENPLGIINDRLIDFLD